MGFDEIYLFRSDDGLSLDDRLELFSLETIDLESARNVELKVWTLISVPPKSCFGQLSASSAGISRLPGSHHCRENLGQAHQGVPVAV